MINDSYSVHLSFVAMSISSAKLTALTANVTNFPASHLAVGIASLMTAMETGRLGYEWLYSEEFSRNHDMKTYTLLLTILLVIACVLGFLFTFRGPYFDEDGEDHTDLLHMEKQGLISRDLKILYFGELSGWMLMSNAHFQLLLFGFCFFSVTQKIYLGKLLNFLEVFQKDLHDSVLYSRHDNNSLHLIGPLLSGLGNFTFAALSDSLLYKYPRVAFFAILSLIQTIIFTLCAINSDMPSLIIVTTVILFINTGVSGTLAATILCEEFGPTWFPSTLAGVHLLQSIFHWLLDAIMGAFYGTEASAGHYACSDDGHCFTIGFGLSAILSGTSTLLFYRMYKHHYMANYKEEE